MPCWEGAALGALLALGGNALTKSLVLGITWGGRTPETPPSLRLHPVPVWKWRATAALAAQELGQALGAAGEELRVHHL